MFSLTLSTVLSGFLFADDGHQNGDRYEDEPGCWFGVHSLPLVDTNDDGEGDAKRLVGVKAVPNIIMLHSHRMTVTPGKPLTVRMRLLSARGCGSIDVTGISLAVEPLTGPRWNIGHTAAILRIDGDDRGSATAVATSARSRYRWDLVQHGPLAVLERGERTLEFMLDTAHAPEGATFRVMIEALNWTDHATEAQIIDDTAPQGEAYVDVTVRSNGA